jgi:bifunctional UDP-N-acetylglucosamine pyrophosphorylase/glucosamine-1-phosphate N-acetyltransferase
VLDDPTGYGRIVRDKDNNFVEIVEQIDCTSEQREIREVFPSYYCVRVEDLLLALSRLKNDNKKHEYYLTDIYGILRQAGKKVVAVQAATFEDVVAPNNRQQLADADDVMQARIHAQHRDAGVTIVSGVNTYIEDGASIGPDTIIEPFSFIGRDATIGADCCIGPFASIARQAIVPEGTNICGNISVETTVLSQGRGG